MHKVLNIGGQEIKKLKTPPRTHTYTNTHREKKGLSNQYN